MGTDSVLELRVADPLHGDTAKGRCRLHRETMAKLGLSAGDSITVATDDGTIGVRAYPADEGKWRSNCPERDAVYVGFSTLVGDGETDACGRYARVRPVSPSPARTVVHETLPPGTAPEVAALLSRSNLIGTLAMARTRMAAYRERGTTVHGIFPEVYETQPDGVVVVTENTTIEAHSNDGA